MSTSTHQDSMLRSGKSRKSLRVHGRFIELTVTFSLAIVLLVAFSVIAFQGLSGARAYVHGESQWTKAQKRAVIALFDYAATGDSARYDDFQKALEVNRGDRRARLTLSSDNPDYGVARNGFLAGKNRPEDVDLMIRLFIIGNSSSFFDEALEAWTMADALIARLEVAGQELRTRVELYGPGSNQVQQQLQAIKRLDRALTHQEQLFSHAMGDISHRMTRIFSGAIVTTAFLLIVSASLLARRLSRISERKERALRESEQRYRALVDQPEVGMWHVDPDGRIVYFNEAMRNLIGLNPDEDVEGEPVEQFIAEPYRGEVVSNRKARIDGHNRAIEVELLPRRGRGCFALIHGSPIRLEEDAVGHVGTCVDISARKAAERDLRHQALHDPLTGLPNRKLFLDRLEMALRRGRRQTQSVAVLFIDLDRFKVVNDGLGHSAGDQLLIEAARRLHEVIREPDSIARFGGDEFGVVLEGIGELADALSPAERVAEAFEAAFEINGITTLVRASVGVAMAKDGATPASELLGCADIAMYVAKRNGGGQVHLYDPERDAFQEEHLAFESALWNAAENNELRLHYQPIVDLTNRRVVSLEALVRWQHPELGLLAPDRFIQLAEETGSIANVGRWVARRACEDFTILQRSMGANGPEQIAVNVSDAEFRFGDPVEALREACEATGTQPASIQIEITESMLSQHPDAIRKLEAAGHMTAIDDFGTGYASLDRLRCMPFQTLKIDRSFITQLPHNPVDASIIEAVVHVGRRLDVRIIAEGIETAEQERALREVGCGFGQGWLYAPAMPLEEVLRAIEKGL